MDLLLSTTFTTTTYARALRCTISPWVQEREVRKLLGLRSFQYLTSHVAV